MRLPRSRLGLLAAAFLVGTTIVLFANAATDFVLGRVPLADGTLGSIDAPDVAVFHLVSASLPLIALALAGSRSLLLWAIAILLTALSWIYAVWQIWQDSLTGFAGGANIGLGLIMLAAPLAILFIVAMVAMFRRLIRSAL